MQIHATDLGTLVISQPSTELPPIRISLNVAVGGSLPAGGTVHQILRKSSSAPYDVEWSNDQDAQWGQVTGTITAQADLMALLAAKQSVSGMSNYLTLSQALAGYYPLNNPAGYITASAVDIFLTPSEASAIYQTQANMAPYITDAEAAVKLEPYCYPRYSNPSGFISSIDAANTFYPLHTNPANYATESWVTGRNYITASALTGYATQSWVTSQGYLTSGSLSGYATLSGATFSGSIYAPTLRNLLNSELVIDSYNDTGAGTHYLHKFTPFDGKFVLAPNGGGLTFPDGSTQATSAVSFDPTGYATESWVTGQGYLTTPFDPTGYATESWVTGLGYATESFVTSQGYIGFDTYGRVTFGSGYNPDSTPFAGRFWFQSEKFRYSTSTATLNTIASEDWVEGHGYLTTANLSGYAQLSGATFTGKVNAAFVGLQNPSLNLGASVATNASGSVSGDVWMSDYNLHYKDRTNTIRTVVMASGSNNFVSPQTFTNQINQTLPAVKITNLSTAAGGHSLVVEDVTSPDTSAFVVDANGNVGVGVDPSTWVAGNKVEIVGSFSTTNGRTTHNPTDINTPAFNLGSQISSTPANAVSGDMWITNATAAKLAYRVGANTYYPTVANAFNTFTGGVAISGTTASNPQLQVTQGGTAAAVIITSTGAGNALVVEDSTSPDANAFVIDQFGKVGIGTAPDATAAIKIDGNGMSFNGLVVNPTSVANPLITSGNMSHSEYLKELLVTINGVQYAIPLRVV